jgi:hypothetical protein
VRQRVRPVLRPEGLAELEPARVRLRARLRTLRGAKSEGL